MRFPDSNDMVKDWKKIDDLRAAALAARDAVIAELVSRAELFLQHSGDAYVRDKLRTAIAAAAKLKGTP